VVTQPERLQNIVVLGLAEGAKQSPSGNFVLTPEELAAVTDEDRLVELLRSGRFDVQDALATLEYEAQLEQLQIELVKLQQSVVRERRRIAILFEGRDAAGKGGTIRRFTEHLNPRAMRVVALPKPTDQERGQWYFQRYIQVLPNPGEVVFFDRSWYNRAVVEPVMGFCNEEQHRVFLQQVPEFEHMLYEDGIEIVKFWFSISKDEQHRRFESRRHNPLKQWKLSPVDEQAQELWDEYTRYKEAMFRRTHTAFAPWIIVKANSKRQARLESLRYVLSTLPYDGRDSAVGDFDLDIVDRYHRGAHRID
jgi:polyphosphate kinase 2